MGPPLSAVVTGITSWNRTEISRPRISNSSKVRPAAGSAVPLRSASSAAGPEIAANNRPRKKASGKPNRMTAPSPGKNRRTPCDIAWPTLVAGPSASRTTAICPIKPATATRIDNIGTHDGGCSPDRVAGGTRTLATTSGRRTSARATLASKRPSRASTSCVSSHALEIDNLAIAFPLIGLRYAGPRPFTQRLPYSAPLAI
jgi:hypothetical protein